VPHRARAQREQGAHQQRWRVSPLCSASTHTMQLPGAGAGPARVFASSAAHWTAVHTADSPKRSRRRDASYGSLSAQLWVRSAVNVVRVLATVVFVSRTVLRCCCVLAAGGLLMSSM
jgi:hypothetical protein